MAVKKKTKSPAKKTAKKVVKKTTTKKTIKKPKQSASKKGNVLECRVCGYRLIVDRECPCPEEHVLVCCGKPMKKVRAARAAT
ncbi:MAG: hypothetical protein RBR88_06255 [Candidatus Saccharicenans sp.]|nr:hypothetical protein [Candidatus Saccharicenans sp.]